MLLGGAAGGSCGIWPPFAKKGRQGEMGPGFGSFRKRDKRQSCLAKEGATPIIARFPRDVPTRIFP